MIIKRETRYSPRGKNRVLHIYLPSDYEHSTERYPVMYFFDGHNLFRDEDATYGTCWGLETFLDRWRKPVIIIGIECGHEGNERLDEYSPYDMEIFDFGQTHGIGNQTLQWMVSELKPEIDTLYRTWPFREATGIGGSSMGGLMALYAIARYNMYFSKAACLSSSIIPCFEKLRQDIQSSVIHPDTRVYLSYGTEEAGGERRDTFRTLSQRYHQDIAAEIERHAARAKIYIQSGGRHCEADWAKQVPDFMEYLWMQ